MQESHLHQPTTKRTHYCYANQAFIHIAKYKLIFLTICDKKNLKNFFFTISDIYNLILDNSII